jgi:peroxiredoxin
VKESAAFGRVVERYRDRDVAFVAVHVQDTMSDVRRFIKANKVTYPIGVDPKLNLGNRYGFKGSPYTVVIDRTGEIVQRWAGEGVPSRLPKLLDSLLKPTTS